MEYTAFAIPGRLRKDLASVNDESVVHGSRGEVKASMQTIVSPEFVIHVGDISKTLLRALIPSSPLRCALRVASCLISNLGSRDCQIRLACIRWITTFRHLVVRYEIALGKHSLLDPFCEFDDIFI